jgi:hypothetical protein
VKFQTRTYVGENKNLAHGSRGDYDCAGEDQQTDRQIGCLRTMTSKFQLQKKSLVGNLKELGAKINLREVNRQL